MGINDSRTLNPKTREDAELLISELLSGANDSANNFITYQEFEEDAKVRIRKHFYQGRHKSFGSKKHRARFRTMRPYFMHYKMRKTYAYVKAVMHRKKDEYMLLSASLSYFKTPHGTVYLYRPALPLIKSICFFSQHFIERYGERYMSDYRPGRNEIIQDLLEIMLENELEERSWFNFNFETGESIAYLKHGIGVGYCARVPEDMRSNFEYAVFNKTYINERMYHEGQEDILQHLPDSEDKTIGDFLNEMSGMQL